MGDGRTWKWAAIGVALTALLVLSAWVARKDFNAQVVKSPTVARTLGYSVTVKVAEAKTEQITDVIGATGAIEALITVRLRALVSDKIVQLGADLGDWVKPGQVLAKIDPTIFQAAVNDARNMVTKAREELAKTQEVVKTQLEEFKAHLATAEDNVGKTTTDLRNAQLQFDRFSILYEQKVIAKVELEVAELRLGAAKSALSTAKQDLLKAQNDLKNYAVTSQAALAAARAAVTTALDLLARNERDLKNTVLLCPVEGIVLQRLKQVGETPGPAEEVFVVGTLESIYMVARVAEEYVSKVHLGGKAETVFDAFPNEKIPGTIAKIDPTTDTKTRTFPVYVRIDNMQKRFKPGLTGFTRIDWRRTALTVPRLAVVKQAEEAMVFVVENGAARIRPVKVLNAPDAKLEVVAGLRDGDRVIYYPVLKIKENDPVRIGDGNGPEAKTAGTGPAAGGAATR